MMPDKLSAALPAQQPDYWIKELSITGGPMVERNLRTAIAFFLHYYRDINIRTKLPSLFKGIDWHQAVQSARFQKDAAVAAFRKVGSEMNLSQPMFFTKPGTSPLALGIATEGRVYCQYAFQAAAEALESRVSSFIWTHGPHDWQEETRPLHYLGVQYIIPVPWKTLRFVRAGNRIQT
jgi:hypothetical protein